MIIGSLLQSIFAGRNHRLRSHRADQGDQRIGIVTLVANDRLRLEPIDQRSRLGDIADLSTGQNVAQRVTQGVDNGVNFGAQPPARAPQRLFARFFWAPAACWWARTTVLSMKIASKSLSSCTDSMILVQTPFLLHREKRV